jgi:hypothetical protein
VYEQGLKALLDKPRRDEKLTPLGNVEITAALTYTASQ